MVSTLILELYMRSHDDYVLNGQWHHCPECGVNWSDADGGCECQESQDPEEEEED